MSRQRVPFVWAAVFTATLFFSWVASSGSVTVSYDNRAILIDGKRRFLQSGSIHYPRSTPQMWPRLIDLAKKGGLDVIQTYVFWDIHEPHEGTYNFAGNYDLVQFVKAVAAAGLYLNLRIGPYVCAEWNFGGFPAWLRFKPHIQFRTDNDEFKAEMERFVRYIVTMMKDQQLFAPQGGPIILAQIENEYGNVDVAFGKAAKTYIQWAADMAQGLDIGVPWVMCQQKNAPGDVINMCNGFYCDSFTPNSPKKPKMWSENWAGWFQNWGRQLPRRPVEDIAYGVARFFAKGGSFQNYYMYHGGTNFGRTAGQWITTSYDYDGPLDEYGDPRQPKWGHLRDLHAAIKLCEPALAAVDGDPIKISLGRAQEAHIYATGQGNTVAEIVSSSTLCAAFVTNSDVKSSDTTVQFNGQSYDLPPWSVSILPDCKSEAFNTAKVGTQTTLMKMVPTKANTSKADSLALGLPWSGTQDLQWTTYQESALSSWGNPLTHTGGLQEQINLTKDSTDYLWYTTSVQVPDARAGTLVINGMGDSLHLFVNGAYAGSPARSFQENFSHPVQLKQGDNSISVLSFTVGLQNYEAFLEREAAGIGQAQLNGVSSGSVDLNMTSQPWQYQVGMQGEKLSLFTENGARSVTWQSGKPPPIKQALVWYKATVDAPAGDRPVALDLGSMGKGQAWINGRSIGRYWTLAQSNLEIFPGGTCLTTCDYRGSFDPGGCTGGCGEPSQRWYHVPRDWLQSTNNLLVMFEETGGDPSKVSLVSQVPDKVCAHISEVHPQPVVSSGDNNSSSSRRNSVGSDTDDVKQAPKLSLDCTPGHRISALVFGSFGNPSGTCGSFQKGTCHAAASAEEIYLECVGRQRCSLDVSWTRFAVEDPCPEKSKSLAIEALCAPF